MKITFSYHHDKATDEHIVYEHHDGFAISRSCVCTLAETALEVKRCLEYVCENPAMFHDLVCGDAKVPAV